eukprot:gb/GEZN01010328.1/.p1 GENE.gb/GEZN01010328.1/~~gb/GEZN01010328.1/.p1  ORF type:complete len:295 (+),score=24.58 gb/GEZN01010328.1/:91-975(+)
MSTSSAPFSFRWTRSVGLALSLLWLTFAIHLRNKQKKRKKKLCVSDWSPDTVYLCQFPRSPGVCSISPYALKLESWLRIHNVPYQNKYTLRFSGRAGWIPYLELNGEQVDDTSVLTHPQQTLLQTNPPCQLSAESLAITHACISMMELRFLKTVFYWRYGLNFSHFYALAIHDKPGWKEFMTPTGGVIWGFFQRRAEQSRVKELIRSGEDVMFEQACDDLRALSAILGAKLFFFGDVPTTLDCAVFGYLVQVAYMPQLNFPYRHTLESECSNLMGFLERFKARVWPDWDQLCSL